MVNAFFTDPEWIQEAYPIPFLLNDSKVDGHTILVGHSSGAITAIELTQQRPIQGSFLIAPTRLVFGWIRKGCCAILKNLRCSL